MEVFEFPGIHFAIARNVRFPQYFLPNRKVPTLFSGEILFNEAAASASKVIQGICQVLTDVDFAVWVGNFIDDFHEPPSSDFRT
jgi:hypothetical protein